MKPSVSLLLTCSCVLSACRATPPLAPILTGEIVYAIGDVTYAADDPVFLPTLDDVFDVGRPYAINASGQIVGEVSLNPPHGYVTRAVMWQSGEILDLHRVGWTDSSAFDINDAGDIVGSHFSHSAAHHAFLLRSGTLHELGDQVNIDHLGNRELYPPLYGSRALAINEEGQIVGWFDRSTTEGPHLPRAIRWQVGNAVTWDWVGPGDPRRATIATDVNELDLVVGYSSSSSRDGFDVFYDDAGPLDWMLGDGNCDRFDTERIGNPTGVDRGGC